MRELEFSGQLTEDDYGVISGFASRKWWTVSAVCITILIINNIWQGGGLRDTLSSPSVAILTWLPIVVFIPVVFVAQRFFVRRHWRSNKIMQRPIRGTVSEEGITWEIQGLSSAHVPWDLLLRYRQSSDILLVYQGISQVFYFFPRYFVNESQWQEFRELVARKQPSK